MQIHELNSFVGTPSSTDYLAIDDGDTTTKVPATSLGVSTAMTQAEAETGTETAPRVISPAVLNSFVNTLAQSIAQSVAQSIAQDLLVVEEVLVGTGTAEATSSASASVDVTKTGYTPIGIVGIRKTGATYGSVPISRFSLSDATVSVNIYNATTASRTWTIYADVLYVKNY